MHTNFATGDILHCWRDTCLSRTIRIATRSQFSHTALFIVMDGEPYIIDAQNDGVQLRPFDAWMKKYNYNFVVTRKRMSDTLVNFYMRRRALSKIGTTGYDFEGLIVKSPLKLITGKWKLNGKEEKRMFCSEFVMWVYEVKDSYKMTPKDAYKWCLSNYWEEIYNSTLTGAQTH